MKNSLSDLKLRIRNSEAQDGERLVALRRRYNMYATHRLHGGGSDIVIITPTHDKIQLFNGNKEAFVINSLKLKQTLTPHQVLEYQIKGIEELYKMAEVYITKRI